MRNKYYCIDCNEFKHRWHVIKEAGEGEAIYYCRSCGSPVLKMDKVLQGWLKECVEYIIKKGAEEEYI